MGGMELDNDILNQFQEAVDCNDNLYSEKIQMKFRATLKHGIYKELHRRSLLSDEQLNALLKEK